MKDLCWVECLHSNVTACSFALGRVLQGLNVGQDWSLHLITHNITKVFPLKHVDFPCMVLILFNVTFLIHPPLIFNSSSATDPYWTQIKSNNIQFDQRSFIHSVNIPYIIFSVVCFWPMEQSQASRMSYSFSLWPFHDFNVVGNKTYTKSKLVLGSCCSAQIAVVPKGGVSR